MLDHTNLYNSVHNFPMDTVIPMAAIFYMSHFAEVFETDDKFVTMGYSFDHLKLLTPKQSKMLKKIKQPFYND